MNLVFEYLLTMQTLVLVLIVIGLKSSIKFVPQNRAYVIERFGKFQSTKEAGLNFILPFIDRISADRSLKEKAVGVVPDSMLSALSSVGVLTAVSAILLWRPLKSMQGNVESKKVTIDLVGHSFILNEAVSMTKNPTYRYSGIDWNLSSEQELSAGTLVEVIRVAVGKFIVQEKVS